MKVITLKKIVEFIESKYGTQEVEKIKIKGTAGNTPDIIIIHDAGSDCIKPYMNDDFELEFECTKDSEDVTRCILLQSELEDFNADEPFMGSREALSGMLVINGEIPTREELLPYFYTL